MYKWEGFSRNAAIFEGKAQNKGNYKKNNRGMRKGEHKKKDSERHEG